MQLANEVVHTKHSIQTYTRAVIYFFLIKYKLFTHIGSNIKMQ